MSRYAVSVVRGETVVYYSVGAVFVGTGQETWAVWRLDPKARATHARRMTIGRSTVDDAANDLAKVMSILVRGNWHTEVRGYLGGCAASADFDEFLFGNRNQLPPELAHARASE